MENGVPQLSKNLSAQHRIISPLCNKREGWKIYHEPSGSRLYLLHSIRNG